MDLVLKVTLLAIGLLMAVIGILGETRHGKTGKLTRLGWATLGLILATFLAGLTNEWSTSQEATAKDARRAKQLEDAEARSAETLAALARLAHIVKGQTDLLEKLHRAGTHIPGIPPSPPPRATDARDGRGSITRLRPVSAAPRQFLVDASVSATKKEHNWWIGIRSGLQFWPLVELPAGERSGTWSVEVPTGVARGAVVLAEAGTRSRTILEDHAGGSLPDVGLYLPNLKDLSVAASMDFD